MGGNEKNIQELKDLIQEQVRGPLTWYELTMYAHRKYRTTQSDREWYRVVEVSADVMPPLQDNAPINVLEEIGTSEKKGE